MAGSGGSSSTRVSGVDRFYNPPAVRRQLELQKLQQQRQQQEEATLRTRPSPVATTEAVAEVMVTKERFERDDVSSKRSLSSSSSPSPSPSLTPPPLPASSVGNLYRLLESTTPVVPARYFSKASSRRWRNGDEGKSQPYFCVGDLWESFKEWSAYGAGVPLVLDGSDTVVQYYVPFLSAIQLYVDTSAATSSSGRSAEESDGNCYLDTSSEGSSGSEENQSRERSSSVGTANHIGQGGFVNDNTEVCPKPTLPIFEYFEKDTPYGREPLADKISVLANKFPDLKTYKSCDMLPLSWMSVAWYPIYRIPMGPTLKDLDACFLTFHSLATPSDNASPPSEVLHSCTSRNGKNSNDRPVNLCLPVFGLASYKFRGSIWTSTGLQEQQLASSLSQAADDWLRHLQVDHPDYRFFLSHSNTFRR
ncbi:unnamed protein product [Musa acuminata subsp. malaccensis]|uniref:(wild Malaysian banana) hypothetical protein n=1 Tax=Musa acuminata subsp. malaccensis TaxID=214687 RepID=A0A804K3J3_MUSAM|nr:PREDICTED: uncharacterized protein LOC103993683 [Musa acuminata subsp. malaccensis]CAG1830745.1 unnamed protein product [Musa acuminata subsp. malaccensis]